MREPRDLPKGMKETEKLFPGEDQEDSDTPAFWLHILFAWSRASHFVPAVQGTTVIPAE